MATKKKTGNKKSSGGKNGRPPMVTKAGVKHGTRYSCGGRVKK